MKAGHIAFNIVGLFIAGLCLVSGLASLFIVLPDVPPNKVGLWYFLITFDAIMILMLGGGGIANFAKGRLAPWPTGTMIAAYCISIWLLPLAIWGVIALLGEKKRQNIERGTANSGLMAS